MRRQKQRHRPAGGSAAWVCVSLLLFAFRADASLQNYDRAISEDPLIPVARLTNAVTLTGANRAAFNFGANSGDVTMEFILEGNPTASTSAYLAVGANASSNLRYEEFNNTGQLGFTQLGVADYLFSPAVPSPETPTHIAYIWNATTHTMSVYVNGSFAGSRSGVSTAFAMPTGQGFLGANPSNTENMTGTIHRLTVYDDIISDEAIQRHSDAFNDVVRLPIVISFRADPSAIFTPASATLSWSVQRATGISINGLDVTGSSNLVISPGVTTTYILTATNAAGSVQTNVTVLVNPAPVIDHFAATRTYIAPGETTTLNWIASYGSQFSIAPNVGDVTGLNTITIQPSGPTTYTLAVANSFGTATASVTIHIATPANRLVISEFMADDSSILPDEDGQFSGWIEIYNPTTNAINLSGYFLTDDESDPAKWAFPARNLPAGAYLVVFASGKDRAPLTGTLHANFRLANAGEYLALIGPGPVLLHAFAPAFPPQRENISYGILAGDVSLLRYMGTPTPGAVNDEAPARPARVTFSRPSGTFTNSFQVTLSTSTPGTQIRYTLDGSAPGTSAGIVYSSPLVVTNTTRIRAASIADGQVSEITRATYIKLASELAGYTSPLPILVVDNFGAGTIPQKGWSGNGSGIKQVPRQDAVWATFERSNGASALTSAPDMLSRIGIRGRGAFSTQWRQKPYSVEALDESGDERKVSPLGLPEHADWVLYFPDPDDNKDPTLLFNTFPYELSRNTGRYSVRFRWVEAFINEDGGELGLADRRGVYALIEKVSRGKDRLDFAPLSDDGSTGSWLLNINRMDPEPENGWPAPNGATQPWFFHTAGPNRVPETPPNALVVGDDEPQQSNGFLNFDNPSGFTINANQRAAIEAWFKQFEDVLWNNAIWRDPVIGYRKYLDPLDFADYFILNVLTRNGDGLLISMFPWKGDDGKLRMGPAWDYNWQPYYISGTNATGSLMWRSDRLWYKRLFADPDFVQLYIDRWWDLRRGAMSNSAMDAIIDGQSNEITPAKALLNGLPSAIEWTNRLVQMKNWLKTRADWIDSNYIRPPAFNVNGGDIPEGFQLVVIGTNGTIYFTTDGSDPRAPGGAVAASAQAYQGAFPLLSTTVVQTRIKNGTNWSGLTAALFRTPQDLSRLVVSEIMYNPAPVGAWTSDDLEFIELKNTGTNILRLDGLAFTAGINFSFTNGTRLAPGAFFLLARNPIAFSNVHPGVQVNGVYTGRLDNGGETLRLQTSLGNTILDLTYNDRAPWPVAADGYGFSIVPSAAPDNSDNGTHWRASATPGGSPGLDDPPQSIPAILINEILTHTDPPLVDAIELFNATAQDVDISGWFLSDDGANPRKFRIPNGTTISANGYRVFTEADFNPTPPTLGSFSLDSAGDSIYLCSGDSNTNLTGYSHSFDFGAAANAVSFGRYVNSVGEEQFPAQVANTFGASNAGPLIGPVVIQEIQYHPEDGVDEFIELRNITGSPLPLFDPDYPTNTWRVNGISFSFPTNTVIGSNETLLVVAIDPAAFHAKYSVAPQVRIFGPFTGALQDNGERLELQRPDIPATNGVAYITVDEVRYNDKAPWPPAADGGGPSLQRKNPFAYGNDPANWTAAVPTPGAEFVPGEAPLITSQPQNQIVVVNRAASFSVAASGAQPLYFQWLFNDAPLSEATNAILAISNVRPSHAGIYQAVVFNAAGSASSAPARLSVLYPPVIQQHPQSVVTNIARSVTFNVLAYGAGALRYQWRFNGLPITDATNASYTIASVQAANDGYYDVIVTDSIDSSVSQAARLIVPIAPAIIQSPLTNFVPQGASVTLSVVLSNTTTLPVGYRWRKDGGTVQSNYLSSYSDFLTINNVQTSNNYDVAVYNLARPGGLLSSRALVMPIADTDGDGIPDFWEIQYGLNTNSVADASADPDGDGMSNLAEYIAGTDPRDRQSYLRIDLRRAPGGGTNAMLTFVAVSNKTYTIQFANQLPNFQKLIDVAAKPATHLETIIDPSPVPRRYYRLATPVQP